MYDISGQNHIPSFCPDAITVVVSTEEDTETDVLISHSLLADFAIAAARPLNISREIRRRENGMSRNYAEVGTRVRPLLI